ncbi:MAG: amidohydrolase family protein, partial [candidate division Zixibacteria bacterium]|nr:amidohydrolase family protein [candidate division Zixibacteria bacterium]
MKSKTLIYNARIHTQADSLVVDSMAICRNRIVAIGNNLRYDSDFESYDRIDLKGRSVMPGLVDAHTHFYFFALTFNRVSLRGLDSVEGCLRKIKTFASSLKKSDWVVGEGYSPELVVNKIAPDRFALDRVTDGRPAFLFSRDEHTVWVNSRALELAGISKVTPQPTGGEIVKSEDGTPTGILRESSSYGKIYDMIPQPSKRNIDRCYRRALDYAYSKGVTGVHSFDSADAFSYLSELAERGKVGLRINYYPPAGMLSYLHRNCVRYGMGTDFLRIAGVKIFADGSLGSQTALCFNKYHGSVNGY